jgi:hypothetical protein
MGPGSEFSIGRRSELGVVETEARAEILLRRYRQAWSGRGDKGDGECESR